MSAIKWHKWRQELEFLGQLDRYRYLKYFFIPSSLACLTGFGVDDAVGAPINIDQAVKIANAIEIAPDPGGGYKGPPPMRIAVGSPNAPLGFVAQDCAFEIARPFVRCLSPGGELAGVAPSRQEGIGDFLRAQGRGQFLVETVKRAVDRVRQRLRQGQEDLAREARIGDFVSP